MKIKSLLYPISFVFVLLVFNFIETNVISQKATNDKFTSQKKPIITPSNLTEKLENIKKSNPKISSQELVRHGNDLIGKIGFDYDFYTCEIAEDNDIHDMNFVGEDFRNFDFPFENLKGKKITFQIMNKVYGHPCGCVFEIPLTKAVKNDLTIIADGNPISVKHLKKYNIEYAELVNKDLKKIIRTWYKPMENQPFGISKDGTKIYVETAFSEDDFLNKEGLLLEISENGIFQFVLKSNPNIISKYEYIENFPKDENNAYLGYLKFTDGKIEHILKVSFPCT